MDYISGPNTFAVLLPYDDGRFAFLGILPNEGIKERTIPELISQKINTHIAVTFPKFKTSGDFELKDALKNMGLGIAFDGIKADFSKMGNANEKLVISSVKHKIFLQVDELGTEAGAVTDVVVKAAGIKKGNWMTRDAIKVILEQPPKTTQLWCPLVQIGIFIASYCKAT